MRKTLLGGTSVVAVTAALAMSMPAQAASSTIAAWEMNECKGATVLLDSGPSHYNGHIGSAVTPSCGTDYFDLRSHQWGTPVTPQHLDTVPDEPGLSPGTRNFAITLRLKWNGPLRDVNLVQKGQGSVPGWKVGSARAHVLCQFLGSLGVVTVDSSKFTHQTWADGNWHVVTCARQGKTVSLTIDNHLIGAKNGPTGNIVNNWPVSIAGKSSCDNKNVWCDYWSGWMDYIHITSP